MCSHFPTFWSAKPPRWLRLPQWQCSFSFFRPCRIASQPCLAALRLKWKGKGKGKSRGKKTDSANVGVVNVGRSWVLRCCQCIGSSMVFNSLDSRWELQVNTWRTELITCDFCVVGRPSTQDRLRDSARDSTCSFYNQPLSFWMVLGCDYLVPG